LASKNANPSRNTAAMDDEVTSSDAAALTVPSFTFSPAADARRYQPTVAGEQATRIHHHLNDLP